MAIVRRKLNEDHKELLKKIFEFGGYTTSISLNNFIPDRDISNIRRLIYKLVESGYLREFPFYSDSRRHTMLYQVTAKTCRLFDNPDSYFRKKHEDPYIIRGLIKQHFFFEICSDFEKNIIANHEDRVHLLKEKFGLNERLLPRKYNKSVPMVHVEEYILDTANAGGKKLFSPASSELVYNFTGGNNGPVFIYVDKYQSNPASQVLSLVNDRYGAITQELKVPVSFLIVVDDKDREASYKKAIIKALNVMNKGKKAQEIPENIIDFHIKSLLERVKVAPNSVKKLPMLIKEKYSQVQEISAKDLEGLPLDQISLHGLETVKSLVDSAVTTSRDYEEIERKITELFRKIYKLYSARLIQEGKYLDIKTYRIGYKFSM